jgi:hypothetical protein
MKLLASFDTAKLDELRDLRRIFRAPHYEKLFELWKQQGRPQTDPMVSGDQFQLVLKIYPMGEKYDFL